MSLYRRTSLFVLSAAALIWSGDLYLLKHIDGATCRELAGCSYDNNLAIFLDALLANEATRFVADVTLGLPYRLSLSIPLGLPFNPPYWMGLAVALTFWNLAACLLHRLYAKVLARTGGSK